MLSRRIDRERRATHRCGIEEQFLIVHEVRLSYSFTREDLAQVIMDRLIVVHDKKR
jgi:hypothetical protein